MFQSIQVAITKISQCDLETREILMFWRPRSPPSRCRQRQCPAGGPSPRFRGGRLVTEPYREGRVQDLPGVPCETLIPSAKVPTSRRSHPPKAVPPNVPVGEQITAGEFRAHTYLVYSKVFTLLL